MARIPDDSFKSLHSLLLLGNANFITVTIDLASYHRSLCFCSSCCHSYQAKYYLYFQMKTGWSYDFWKKGHVLPPRTWTGEDRFFLWLDVGRNGRIVVRSLFSVVLVSFLLLWSTILTKISWGRKWFVSFYTFRSQLIIQGSQGRNSREELKTETTRYITCSVIGMFILS